MIIFNELKYGIFLNRQNRFVAEVLINNKIEKAHLANTGRMSELLITGKEVLLYETNKADRKTNWDLFAINSGGFWVCLRACYANEMLYQWLNDGLIPELKNLKEIKREYKRGDHRIDFYGVMDNQEILIEVKSVNYFIDNNAYFPDAPTKRGCQHLETLIDAQKSGLQTFIIFVLMGKQVDKLRFNYKNDPMFAKLIKEASSIGVKIIVCESEFTLNGAHFKDFRSIDWGYC